MSLFNFFCLLFFLCVTSVFAQETSFPYSSRNKLAQKCKFSGSKRNLDKGVNLNLPKSFSDKTDLEIANELSIREVYKNGDEFLIKRDEEYVSYLRQEEFPEAEQDMKVQDTPLIRRLSVLGDPSNEEIIFSPELYDYAKYTGRLTYSGGVCSGILIGSKYVLTAAHCLHEGNGGDWYNNFKFYPQQTSSNSPEGINWFKADIFDGWVLNDETPYCSRIYDIGIIELEYSANIGYANWGISNNLELNQYLKLYGYKNGNLDMVKTSGNISKLFNEYLHSDNSNIYPGHSGSGIYIDDGTIDAGIKAVHVTSCGTKNGHTRITQWKKDLFDQFMNE